MLTLQFVPYNEIEDLGSARRVNKLIDIVMDNKIVMLEGRLKREEEADLIAIAMEKIDQKFKGIELAVIDPKKDNLTFIKTVKQGLAKILLGNRAGFTVIGPATVVKEIKKDPDKIEVFTSDSKVKDGNSKRKKKG